MWQMRPRAPHGNTITVCIWVGEAEESLKPKGFFSVTLAEWAEISNGAEAGGVVWGRE
jgi:hypothetical protein